MRNKLADIIYKTGSKNKKICVLVADISPAGSMSKFREKHPKRFINTGVAEQSMIGIAAGMALRGFRPFCYTIATFALYRPFEMIRVDLCYQNLPVTVVGMGTGTVYSTLGGTHLTQEDISIARSIPNMNIIAPCDPLEMEDAVKYCCSKSKGPTYLRIGKAGEKIFINKFSDKWKFGKIRKIVPGKDICILTFGPIIKKAFEIRDKLKSKNLSIEINSCHTLKPFDFNGLRKKFKKFKKIIIIEDHSKIGGLNSIVKTAAHDESYRGKILNFSLKDEFIHCYGSQDDLLDKHDMSTKKIFKKILENLK
jgi:transketolase